MHCRSLKPHRLFVSMRDWRMPMSTSLPTRATLSCWINPTHLLTRSIEC